MLFHSCSIFYVLRVGFIVTNTLLGGQAAPSAQYHKLMPKRVLKTKFTSFHRVFIAEKFLERDGSVCSDLNERSKRSVCLAAGAEHAQRPTDPLCKKNLFLWLNYGLLCYLSVKQSSPSL